MAGKALLAPEVIAFGKLIQIAGIAPVKLVEGLVDWNGFVILIRKHSKPKHLQFSKI